MTPPSLPGREDTETWAKALWRRIAGVRCLHSAGGWACDACLMSLIADDADALLARLRPAWEASDEAYNSHASGLHVIYGKELDRLRADLAQLTEDRRQEFKRSCQIIATLNADLQKRDADLAACAEALTQALLPLEALNASVQWELSPPVMGVIAEAIASGRAALARVAT